MKENTAGNQKNEQVKWNKAINAYSKAKEPVMLFMQKRDMSRKIKW